VATAIITRRLAMVLGLTALFLLVEVVGGVVSGSLALLADAGHMATDVGALALALIGARIAQRRASAAHHFGNLRWEVLAALINGVAVFAIAVMIGIEAIERLNTPREIDAVLFGLVATAGLIVNLISLRVLHGHHHGDLNVRGAYLHILGDVLGSVGAIIAAIVIRTTGWVPADAIISIFIALLILRSAARLIGESATILLDRVPPDVDVAAVERILTAPAEVARVHDVHVWTVTPGLNAVSAHLVVPDLEAHPEVLRSMHEALAGAGMGHVTLQLETGGICGGEQCGELGHHHHGGQDHGHGNGSQPTTVA
jgi:cobalt-zinc-cadmium efflux system protein